VEANLGYIPLRNQFSEDEIMSLKETITVANNDSGITPDFPHAPPAWTPAIAIQTAQQEGLKLSEDHWDALRALQKYFAQHEDMPTNMRVLHDALDERFHVKGGLKGLYLLFPGGPVAQGCRIAGLQVPPGAIDKNFGSVG